MRPLLAVGGLVASLGIVLLLWGVREQIVWSGCSGVRCPEPAAWPITVGMLMLIGGGFFLIWTLASGFASQALGGPRRPEVEDQERLRRAGVPGIAHIVGFEDTGSSIDDGAVVDLGLAVEMPDRPPFQVKTRTVVPFLHLGRLAIGLPVPVLVDPDNHEDVVVEWSLQPSEPARPQTAPGRKQAGPAGEDRKAGDHLDQAGRVSEEPPGTAEP